MYAGAPYASVPYAAMPFFFVVSFTFTGKVVFINQAVNAASTY